MNAANGRYTAFISYRQAEPDRAVAAALHRLLETYRTPRALVRGNVRPNAGRIFLDREEMQSGPLRASLREALAASDFLIVVCSPRAVASTWMRDEIDAFLETHPRERILPLLIEGTPETSFPLALRGGSEPLAADATGDPKLRTEKLRLLAPMLGTTYAALRRRDRARRLRRTIFGSAAALLLILLVAAAIIGTNTRRVWTPHPLTSPIANGLRFATTSGLADDRMIWAREDGFAIYDMRTLAPELVMHGARFVYSSTGGRYLFLQPPSPATGPVRAFDWRNRTQHRLDVPSEIGIITAWSGSSEDLVSWIEEAGGELRVRVRSIRENREVASLAALVDSPYVRRNHYFALAFDPDRTTLYPGTGIVAGNRYVVTGARGSRLVTLLWDVAAPRQPMKILTVDPAAQFAVWAYDPKHDTIAVLEGAMGPLQLSLWRAPDGALLRRRELPPIPPGANAGAPLVFAENGRRLLAPASNGFFVLDATTLEGSLRTFGRSASQPKSMRTAAEAWLFPSAGGAVFENIASGRRHELSGFPFDRTLFDIQSVVIASRDGRRLLVRRQAAAPELWDVDGGRRLATLPVTGTGILQFSADERLITATKDGNTLLFDAVSGESVRALRNTGDIQPTVARDPRCPEVVAWFSDGRILRYTDTYEVFGHYVVPATPKCVAPQPPRPVELALNDTLDKAR